MYSIRLVESLSKRGRLFADPLCCPASRGPKRPFLRAGVFLDRTSPSPSLPPTFTATDDWMLGCFEAWEVWEMDDEGAGENKDENEALGGEYVRGE